METVKRNVRQGCLPSHKRRVCPDRFAAFRARENGFQTLYSDVALVWTVAGDEGGEGVEEGSELLSGYRC